MLLARCYPLCAGIRFHPACRFISGHPAPLLRVAALAASAFPVISRQSFAPHGVLFLPVTKSGDRIWIGLLNISPASRSCTSPPGFGPPVRLTALFDAGYAFPLPSSARLMAEVAARLSVSSSRSYITHRHAQPLAGFPRLPWCRQEELNPQPSDYDSAALPIELCRLILPR